MPEILCLTLWRYMAYRCRVSIAHNSEALEIETEVALMTHPMTPEQREDFYFALQMVDAMDIAEFVFRHHPEVFDLAADRVRNARAQCATPRTALNAEENNS